MENKDKKEKKETTSIVIEGGREWRDLKSIDFISYSEIASAINNVFKKIFKDYYGCKPIVNNTEVEVLLQFTPGADNGIGEVYGVDSVNSPISDSNGSSTMEMFIRASQASRNPLADKFILSEEAMNFLNPYVLPYERHMAWSTRCKQEFNAGYGMTNVIRYSVFRLSLNSLMELLYEKDDDEVNYKYKVSVLNTGVPSMGGANMLFEVQRANPEQVANVQSKYFNIQLPTNNDFVIKA